MSKRKKITRREFLKTIGEGAILGAAGSLVFPSILKANPEIKKPIKIGQIQTTSGLMASEGIPAMRGAKIAEEVVNKNGGILGRKLQIIQEDDEVKPDIGVRKMRKMILEDEVDFLIGTNSSGVGLACLPIVNEFKKIFIAISMTDKYTEENCSPYVFRISVSASMASKASAFCMVNKEPAVKKWGGLNPDYVYGRDSWHSFKKGMEEKGHGVEIVHEGFPPFMVEDFRPYISSLLESGAEGVFTSCWTGDLINLIKQAKPLGFFKRIRAFVNNVTAHAVSVGLGDEMVSFWGESRYYPFYRKTPINTQFVKMYREKYGPYPESENSADCYVAVMALKKAIELAGTTESKAVINALEGLRIEGPQGRKWFRPQDHSAIDEEVLLGKFHKDPNYPFWVYDPKTYFTVKGEELAIPLDKSACKMKKI